MGMLKVAKAKGTIPVSYTHLDVYKRQGAAYGYPGEGRQSHYIVYDKYTGRDCP